MLNKILLGFGFVSNLATLVGLWISYASAPASVQNVVAHRLLIGGAVFSVALYTAFAIAILRAPLPHDRPPESTPPLEKDGPERQLTPDTTVKDSDPKIYVKFMDDRGSVANGVAETCLDLINRGGRNAKVACVDDIHLKEYVITFPKVGYLIVPGNGLMVTPEIQDKSARPGYAKNMIAAFMREWFSYSDYNKHELAIYVTVTYQDDDRNLFETRCELVLHPDQEAKVTTHGAQPGITVVSTRNHQFRKMAIATVKRSLL